MIPDKFNMVDMGGIDLIYSQGLAVPGLYDKLMSAISQCRYQCLYNWKFNEIMIPPVFVEMGVNENEDVVINNGIAVDSNDVISIYSLEPTIIPLSVTGNGEYTPETGVDGFAPVVVDVPDPSLESITIMENGTYLPTEGVYGFSEVVVNVDTAEAHGLEVIEADEKGGTYTVKGYLNNNYLVAYFDDNMRSYYLLNGQQYNFTVNTSGQQATLATTRSVSDNTPSQTDGAIIPEKGSSFTAYHDDTGAYISFVGGWCGFPDGGTIHEQAGATNVSITIPQYSKILLFVGACSSYNFSTVEINGITHDIVNIGAHYGRYGYYLPLVIDNNVPTTLTINFPNASTSYVSIIGFN